MNWSAPGKLFLFGEYAVLRGAPAIVTTVDRRVSALTSTTEYTVLGGDADPSLPAAVEEETGRKLPDLTVDLREFYDGEQKLGFGSSAASAVALTAAALDTVDRSDVLRHAHRAHFAFQGGKGSGGDVAASTFGGTVAVFPQDDPEDAPDVERLDWPDDLEVFAVWTQKSANTRKFVDAVDATTRPLTHMTQLAEAALQAFRDGDVERLLVIARDYDDAMGKLGAAAGVPIRTNTQRKIARVVRDFGATSKPSGAGGGDVSLVFARRGLDRDSLATALPGDTRVLDVKLSVEGLRRSE